MPYTGTLSIGEDIPNISDPTLSLSLALFVSSFLLSFSISSSRVVYEIMEVTKYDRVLAQCDRPAKRRRVIYDSDEEGFEPVVRENYRVTRPNLVGVLPACAWNNSEPCWRSA
jgi:hypothetical protein